MNFKTFYINNPHVRYREIIPGDPLVEKCYLIENPYQEQITAIPDGCVDIQFTWEKDECRGYVCGSFLEGAKSLVGTYHRCFGLKLRPGMLFNFFRQDISELVGRRIPLKEFLECRGFETYLSGIRSFSEMVDCAMSYFHTKEFSQASNIATNAAKLIVANPGVIRVTDMTQVLGYSQRYVNEVFKQSFGLSVKKYSDIIRAQAAINYLECGNVAQVMDNLGYYDQSHFIHDFKQYTSLTPKKYIQQMRQSNSAIIV